VAALPAVASEVASSARVAVSLLARVAESPLRGRVSIEALSGHVVASSFGRASAGLALVSGVVSSSALASSAARGLGGGVVGHRRRHRRPGGGGDRRRRHGAGDRAPGEATGAARRYFGRFASVRIRCANFFPYASVGPLVVELGYDGRTAWSGPPTASVLLAYGDQQNLSYGATPQKG
jgi:hypothetical protein